MVDVAPVFESFSEMEIYLKVLPQLGLRSYVQDTRLSFISHQTISALHF